MDENGSRKYLITIGLEILSHFALDFCVCNA